MLQFRISLLNVDMACKNDIHGRPSIFFCVQFWVGNVLVR